MNRTTTDGVGAQMNAGSRKGRVELMTITPELAAKWLQSNQGNRPVSDQWVSTIEADIRAGLWRLTGDTIKIGVDGSVLDGGHRLAAIVSARRPVRSFVAFDIDFEAKKNIDRNRGRSIGDILMMFRGQRDGRRVAAIAVCIDLLGNNANRRRTVDEVETIYRKYDVGIEWTLRSLPPRGVGGAPVAAAIAFAYSKNRLEVERFTVELRDGVGLKEGDPALALRNYILRDRHASDSNYRRAVCLKALHALRGHLTGVPLVRLHASEETLDYFAELPDAVTECNGPSKTRDVRPLRRRAP